MFSDLPRSSLNTFAIISEILSLGWIEIPEKFQGTGAPGNTLEYLADIEENNYDYPDLNDWELKFHGGNALLTLFHKDPEPKGIMNDTHKDIIPYWQHNTLVTQMAAKLRRLIVVYGKVNKAERKVIKYKSAIAYWDIDIMGFCNAIEQGIICVDFDARTTRERGTSLRNHGTKFRVKISDLDKIYQNKQEIT